MTWIKPSILTDDKDIKEKSKLEFLEISPKHKDELHATHKTSFEKDQKKYDQLFEYEAKKVVQGVPKLTKDPGLLKKAALLKGLRPKPSSGTPPGPPPSQPSIPCSVDMGSEWLTGFV